MGCALLATDAFDLGQASHIANKLARDLFANGDYGREAVKPLPCDQGCAKRTERKQVS